MLEILLDVLKDPKGCALEAKNGEGDSLLEVAEGESHDEVIDYLRDLLGLQGGGLSNMCILM
jgi:ankyrin repeat protein